MNPVAESVVEHGASWIEALGTLAPVVAIALLIVAIVALFVYAQRHDKKSTIETIKVVSSTIVEPLSQAQRDSVNELKRVVDNHFTHDAEDRHKQTAAFERLVDCIEKRTKEEE